jgi:hypothetical protein
MPAAGSWAWACGAQFHRTGRAPIVHFLQGVHDEIDRSLERLGHAIFAHQPVIELRPVFDPVDQPLVVDDNEQVVVRLIALGGMRLIDPGTARVAAVEDHLEDAPGFLPFVPGEREGIVELFEDQLHHAFQLALLLWRQVIKVGLHYPTPSKMLEWLHLPIRFRPQCLLIGLLESV